MEDILFRLIAGLTGCLTFAMSLLFMGIAVRGV